MKKPVMKQILRLCAAGALAISSATMAANGTVEPAQAETLRAAVQKGRPGMPVGDIRPSSIPGLFEVDLAGKDTVYMSADGQYMISGDMYRIESGRFVNVADERLKPLRASKLAAVKKEDMIVFSPKGEVKAYVDVFTDIDCGFCRKLHKEVPALNEMGIEVRYLAFPRAGVPSPSADKLATAWCAQDKAGTLTKLKSGTAVPVKTCDNNPVAAQYQLGNELGVSGTPALFKPDGELLPGYMPAAELAAALGVAVKTPPAAIAAPAAKN